MPGSRAAIARRLIHRLSEATAALLDVDTDPAGVLADLIEAAEAERFIGALPPGYGPFADWALNGAEEPRPWVIPGVLRRASRAVLVAPEGSGKSTLARQVAVCTAAGLHPFRFGAIEPQRVLVVDVENDPATAVAEDGTIDHASAHGVMLTADRHAEGWDHSRLFVWSRPEGLDLRTRRDAGWLEAAIADHRPDVVVAGPLYKMFPPGQGRGRRDTRRGDPTDPRPGPGPPRRRPMAGAPRPEGAERVSPARPVRLVAVDALAGHRHQPDARGRPLATGRPLPR